MYRYSVVKHDRVETISYYPRKTTLNGALLIYFTCFFFNHFHFSFIFIFATKARCNMARCLPVCLELWPTNQAMSKPPHSAIQTGIIQTLMEYYKKFLLCEHLQYKLYLVAVCTTVRSTHIWPKSSQSVSQQCGQLVRLCLNCK